MSYEFYEHKRRDRFKWIIAFGAIILLAVFVLAANTNGFTNADPYGWFTEDETTATDGTPNTDNGDTIPNAEIPDPDGMELPDGSETDEDDSPIKIVDSDMLRLSMTRISEPNPDYNAKYGVNSLTAYPNPDENIADFNVEWDIEWENPDSTWAKGKDVGDYIIFYEVDNIPNTIELLCLEAFGETITITARIVENPEAEAYCSIEFYQKYGPDECQVLESEEGIFFKDYEIYPEMVAQVYTIVPYSVEDLVEIYYNNTLIDFTPFFEETPYTMSEVDPRVMYFIEPVHEFNMALREAGFTPAVTGSIYVSEGNMSVTELINALVGTKLLPTDYDDVVDYDKLNAFNEVCATHDGDFAFSILVTAEGSYDTYHYEYWINFDYRTVKFMPTELYFYTDAIYF